MTYKWNNKLKNLDSSRRRWERKEERKGKQLKWLKIPYSSYTQTQKNPAQGTRDACIPPPTNTRTFTNIFSLVLLHVYTLKPDLNWYRLEDVETSTSCAYHASRNLLVPVNFFNFSLALVDEQELRWDFHAIFSNLLAAFFGIRFHRQIPYWDLIISTGHANDRFFGGVPFNGCDWRIVPLESCNGWWCLGAILGGVKQKGCHEDQEIQHQTPKKVWWEHF